MALQKKVFSDPFVFGTGVRCPRPIWNVSHVEPLRSWHLGQSFFLLPFILNHSEPAQV